MHSRRAKVKAKGRAKEEKAKKDATVVSRGKAVASSDRHGSLRQAGASSARVSTGPLNALKMLEGGSAQSGTA